MSTADKADVEIFMWLFLIGVVEIIKDFIDDVLAFNGNSVCGQRVGSLGCIKTGCDRKEQYDEYVETLNH